MRAGDVVGRFRLERLAATGASGPVFRATDIEGGAAVALKETAAPEHAAREASLLSRIDHAGVARLVAHGPGWIATEWIDGESLADRLARGTLPLSDLVALAVSTTDALAAVHAKGVVHRDVKPDNLFFEGGRADAVRLIDFGVAALFGDTPRSVVGTLGYVAPEQARLAPVDPRADLHALGAVLHRAWTGRLPDAGGTRAALFRAGLPPALDSLLAAMLDPDPVRRPGSAAAVRTVLTDGSIGALGEIVGRETELELLLEALGDAFSRKAARAALVTGEAGIGKSRLREELVARARARHPSLEVWTGRGDPVRAGAPLGILADAIKGACRVRADDPLPLARDKVRDRVGQLGLSDGIARLVGDLALSGTRAPLAREAAVLQGDRVRNACLDLLAAQTARGPVLCVLEDLHWSDPTTPAFFLAALRRLVDRPLFVLGVSRPGAALFDLETAVSTAIDLAPLPLDSAERVVRAALGPAPDPETVRALALRGNGHPLHLRELARAVAAGEARPEGDVETAIRERLEALPERARRVLSVASVFGRAFSIEGLRQILGDEATDDAIALLVSEGIVAERAGAGEHAFRHELLRAAAHAMQPAADRARVHRMAAGWLERSGRADPSVLAEHLEASGERARAARFFRLAAEEALGASDFAAVLRWVDRANACGAAADLRGDLCLLEAEAVRWRGDHPRAIERSREAMRLLPAGSALWWHAAGEAAFASTSLSDHDSLVAIADGLHSEIVPGAAASMVLSVARIASGLLLLGESDRAARLLARMESVAPASALADPLAASRLHSARAIAAAQVGDVEGQLTWAEASAAAADEAGDQRAASGYRSNLGFACWQLGLFERAEAVLVEARAGAIRLGLEGVAASSLQNLAMARAHLGRAAEAIEMLERACAAFAAQRYARFEGGSRTYLAKLLHESGALDRAEDQARRAVRVLESVPPTLAQALAVLARVLVAKDRIAEAVELAREAVAIMDRLGGAEGESTIRLSWVEALTAAGRADEARAALVAARDRLLARGARISNPDLRRSFLERVPDNARTLALAASRII